VLDKLRAIWLVSRRRFRLDDYLEDEARGHVYFLVGFGLYGVCYFLIIQIALWYDKAALPFGIYEFWNTMGGLTDWVISSWPVLAWGSAVTAVGCLMTSNERWFNRNAETIFAARFVTSIRAGVFEEILYRWLIFLGSIVIAKMSNYFLFGFTAWFYLKFVASVANFFTFGALHNILFHEAGWAVGAGMLAANASFRNGHKYLGWFGFANSWFIGIFMFWLLFRYGLLACITIHFLYDALIFFVRYIDGIIERYRDNG